MAAIEIASTVIGTFPVRAFSDGEVEIEVYDSEDDVTHYVYLEKSELKEMLELVRDTSQPTCKDIVDECYTLCESCRGLRDGYPHVVQNYLDDVIQEVEE